MKKEQQAKIDMTSIETKQSARERRFSARQLEYISGLYGELKPIFGNSGLAVVIYHRMRLEVEVHLMTGAQSTMFTMRDIIPVEFEALATDSPVDENPILKYLTGTLQQKPEKRQAFTFEATSTIPAMLFVFGGVEFEKIIKAVKARLGEYTLSIQNAILIDALTSN